MNIKLIPLFWTLLITLSIYFIFQKVIADKVVVTVTNESTITATSQEENIQIREMPYTSIEMQNTGFLFRIGAPSNVFLFDVLYCIYFIGIGLFVVVLYYRNGKQTGFYITKPFLFFLTAWTILFLVGNISRYYWFDRLVKELTSNRHGYNIEVVKNPECIILFILFSLFSEIGKSKRLVFYESEKNKKGPSAFTTTV